MLENEEVIVTESLLQSILDGLRLDERNIFTNKVNIEIPMDYTKDILELFFDGYRLRNFNKDINSNLSKEDAIDKCIKENLIGTSLILELNKISIYFFMEYDAVPNKEIELVGRRTNNIIYFLKENSVSLKMKKNDNPVVLNFAPKVLYDYKDLSPFVSPRDNDYLMLLFNKGVPFDFTMKCISKKMGGKVSSEKNVPIKIENFDMDYELLSYNLVESIISEYNISKIDYNELKYMNKEDILNTLDKLKETILNDSI